MAEIRSYYIRTPNSKPEESRLINHQNESIKLFKSLHDEIRSEATKVSIDNENEHQCYSLPLLSNLTE